MFIDEEESNSKDDESSKKRRVETFRQKEKRKRDMGQATSDKNFVEEEKRILREKADWAVNYWHFISYLSFLCLQTKSTKNEKPALLLLIVSNNMMTRQDSRKFTLGCNSVSSTRVL